MSREWTITVVAPVPWLTANDRRHRYAQADLVAAWRAAAYAAALIGKLPRGLGRIHITPVARFRGSPPVRDIPNLAPTIKACVDGLGPPRLARKRDGTLSPTPGYGLIPDDSDKHVALAQTVVGDPLPPRPYAPAGELILHIREETPPT